MNLHIRWISHHHGQGWALWISLSAYLLLTILWIAVLMGAAALFVPQ
ncbi:MAG: hypothetical protein ACTHN5_22205 [Phycisphaerae bacterium]